MMAKSISNESVVWVSRFLRWGLGSLFIWVGFHYPDGWPAGVFGAVLIISGFFRPRRCLGEKCDKS
jgi:hypothetical protein